MNLPNNPLLLPFYFGSLSEQERLQVEQEMLTDPEALLDYLDLKRHVEGAFEIPPQPSLALWQRLRPQFQSPRAKVISFALVFAMLALVCSVIFLRHNTDVQTSMPQQILFDSSSEHSRASNVL